MLVKYLGLFASVEFFDGGRSHMKQELLEPEDEFSSIQTTNFIKIPTTILKAWQVDQFSERSYQRRKTDDFVVIPASEPKILGGASHAIVLVIQYLKFVLRNLFSSLKVSH